MQLGGLRLLAGSGFKDCCKTGLAKAAACLLLKPMLLRDAVMSNKGFVGHLSPKSYPNRLNQGADLEVNCMRI